MGITFLLQRREKLNGDFYLLDICSYMYDYSSFLFYKTYVYQSNKINILNCLCNLIFSLSKVCFKVIKSNNIVSIYQPHSSIQIVTKYIRLHVLDCILDRDNMMYWSVSRQSHSFYCDTLTKYILKYFKGNQI
jgi:hypothetical protein